MFCLDREIKKHFKCKHFFEGFQLAKLVEIQILSKYVEFEILLTQPYILNSMVELSNGYEDPDGLGGSERCQFGLAHRTWP